MLIKTLISLIKSNKKMLSSSISTLVFINMLLAVAALLRDIVLAYYLGTSPQSDALLIALFIPDTVGNNLFAAAVGVACVPVFAKLWILGQKERLGRTLKNSVLMFWGAALILTILMILGREEIIQLLSPGMSEETSELTIKLLCILLPTILFYPLYNIGASIMQVYKKFNLPALGPLVFNMIFLFSITYGILNDVFIQNGVFIIAWGITCGVVFMAVLVWGGFAGLYYYQEGRLDESGPRQKISSSQDLKSILGTFFPYFLILLAMQTVFFAERYLASIIGEGTISGLNYAYRIAQFPIWVFVAAISTVVFPDMAKSSGIGDYDLFRGTFNRAIRLIALITVPLTLTICLLRVPIISVLLQRGAFDQPSLQITADILAGYSLTIVGQGMIYIGLRFFMAMGKTIQPLVILASTSLITIAADFYLTTVFGPAGLGYGAAFGSILNLCFFFLILKKALGVKMKKATRKIYEILLVNSPLFIILIFLNRLWYFLELENFGLKLCFGMGAGLILTTVYFWALYLLRKKREA